MRILSRNRCVIGEGPIWNAVEKKLYYVNGPEKELRSLDLSTDREQIRRLEVTAAALGFTQGGETLISCQDGAFLLRPDGSRCPLYDPDEFEIRYGNDAKVGPDGRFYVGTQSSRRIGTGTAADGKLYSIDHKGQVRVLLDGLLLSNGFDWSMDGKFLYHADSDTGFIREYDFDKVQGTVDYTGRQVYVKNVDGLTIDENDFLYAACWGMGHIALVDTRRMQIAGYIPVPTAIPASCCFAGPQMDSLVVVTATFGTDPGQDPQAGFTFAHNSGTRGRLPYLFGPMEGAIPKGDIESC